MCIYKIINDYNSYTVFGNCVLDNSEAVDAKQILYNVLYDNPDVGVGVFKTSVIKNYGHGDTRDVNLVISQKMLDEFLSPKEAADNGKHNPKEE